MSTRASSRDAISVVDGGGEIIETCTICGGHQRVPMEPASALLDAMQTFAGDHAGCRRGESLRLP